MFEGIGRPADREDRKREATSVVLTTALCAAGLGFWMGVAAWHLSDPVAVAAVDTEMEPLVLDLSMLTPDSPLPQAPAPKIVQQGEPEPEAAPTPPDPDAAPQELTEPPDKVASTSGDPEGTADGDPDGTVDGDPNGQGEGDGDGAPGLGGAVHTVHVGDLQWKRRPSPEWPSSATQLGIQEVSCLADVVFADTGEPLSVTIRGCPTVFHEGTRLAILKSRVYPFKLEGRKVSVKSTVRVRYVLR